MTDIRPSNPAFDSFVRAAVEGMPFARLLGVEVLELKPGQAALALPYREDLSQGQRFFQAGAIGTLADFAGGAASATLLPEGWSIMTLDFTIKIVAPGLGERLIARGDVTRPGQSVSVSGVEVFSCIHGREKLCAVGLVSCRLLEPPVARRRAADQSESIPRSSARPV